MSSAPNGAEVGPASDAVLERDGLILRARVYGDAASPVVLLVHGFPDTPHSWDEVVPRLVADGYRVVVPWLRGYTIESVNRSASYDVPTVAGDLIAWQEWAGGAPVHLIGHDWVRSQRPSPSNRHRSVGGRLVCSPCRRWADGR